MESNDPQNPSETVQIHLAGLPEDVQATAEFLRSYLEVVDESPEVSDDDNQTVKQQLTVNIKENLS